MLSKSIAFASLAALVSGADFQVMVGGGALTFTPAEAIAQIGDTVTFVFNAKNHTVTQSSFVNPCTRFRNSTTRRNGFDSGFKPVAAGTTDLPTMQLRLTTSEPIWLFCAQGNHCAQGMVASINAATTGPKTLVPASHLSRLSSSLFRLGGVNMENWENKGLILEFGYRFAAYKAIAMGGPAPANTTTATATDTSSAADPSRSPRGGGSLGPGQPDLSSADPTAGSPTLSASALPTTATRATYVLFPWL